MNEEMKKELASLLEQHKQGMISEKQLQTEIEKLGGMYVSKSDFEGMKQRVEAYEQTAKAQGQALSLLQKGSANSEQAKSIFEAFVEMTKSEEFKAELKEVKSNRKDTTGEFELKVDTSSVSADVARTIPTNRIYSDPSKKRAVLGLFTSIAVATDKNRIMYNDASYTDNTGYVEELAEMSKANTASMQEKYRELSKIGSFIIFSSELLEDFSTFASWAEGKAYEGILNKLDDYLLTGDGADGGANTKHIYGLKEQGVTEFDATTAQLANYQTNANLLDLIGAAATQIAVQSEDTLAPSVVLMHPATKQKIRTLKNTTADYLDRVSNVNGEMYIDGIRVVASTKIGPKELYLLDQSTLQLYTKRSVSAELERVAKTDSYALYMWWRGQELVTRPDKLGNVHVADTEVAIAAISAAE